MTDDILGHIAYKITNAPVQHFPFPHIYVQDIFPEWYYLSLRSILPPADNYVAVSGKYSGRKFSDPNNEELLDPLKTDSFNEIMRFPFRKHIEKRCGPNFAGSPELRLIMDSENYSIGPHTDAQYKVLSYLFYLPADDSLKQLGTSIYLPRDQSFRCPGGPHYPYEPFIKVHTAPFLPNSMFAFFKTDFSFHGVEPITIPCRRDVLLWNLYDRGK